MPWGLFRDVPSGAPRICILAGRFSRCERRLILCYALFGLAYIVPATFLPAMARARTVDPVLFGAGWPLFGVAAVASTVLAGRMVNTAGPLPVWRQAALLMGAGMVLPALMPGIGAVLVASICVGGTFMVITLAGMEAARRFGRARAPRLMGAMTAGFAAGQLLGPLAMIASGMRSTEPLCLLAACGLAASVWLLRDPSAVSRSAHGG
jgi:MFS family permease